MTEAATRSANAKAESHQAHAAPRKGRLTVYVAAAPGAGKTYAMLEEGHRLKDAGKDVVVGLVETYGRPKTIALLEGLEVLPRKRVQYKNMELQELDLEGIIARHPDVVLIDEIYHNNAPSLVHSFRYEDVEDIRNPGIDVLTTMNIQHLDSIKDVAEQIAGVTIRETIPDRILEDADEIQLVDISPEALRKRMTHGNIYPQQNVGRALTGFFRPGNLAALRELALTWLASAEAERTGEAETLVHENVLGAVREPGQAEGLIRRAVRMSKRHHGTCTIVTVLRPGELLSDEMEEAQKVAQALEAEFEPLVSSDPAQAIIDAVREKQVTHLVIGAPGGKFLERVRGSVVDTLLEELKEVDLHIIARHDPVDASDKKAIAVVQEAEDEMTSDALGTEGGERGYLRIYIGYAPGCGTTYTMLREGQRRASRGTKVVVGAAATYGLPGNEEALAGLTVIPPRTQPDRPGGSADMDLDAVLASGAQVVCVDDIGYQNRAPNAKYRYRFEEVEALRQADFKVVATVHLRDVASVAPLVHAATGVQREGVVPDRVLKEATEVEVVDVPPKVLLARLEEHEVPVPAERREELRQIYTLEVLGRLRELALRVALSQTDARLLRYMEERGITSPWESMARVMACVAPVPGLDALIERAALEARRAEGKLVVVSVHEGDANSKDGSDELAALENRYQQLTLERGGQYVVVRSPKPSQALLDYAKQYHVTEIVLARGHHEEKAGPFGSSIKRDIIRGAVDIDIHVLRRFQPQEQPAA